MVLVNIDASEVLDDLSDDDLVEELRNRNVAAAKIASLLIGTEYATPDAKTIADDVLCWLYRRNDSAALMALDNLIKTLVPPDIVAAIEHLRAGRRNAAICALDDFISPFVPPSKETYLAAIRDKAKRAGDRSDDPASDPVSLNQIKEG